MMTNTRNMTRARGGHRRLGLLLVLCLMLAPLLSACSGPDFGSFSDDLQFGDEQLDDTMQVQHMGIPKGGLGKLIGKAELDKVSSWRQYILGHAMGTADSPKAYLKANPGEQCRALKEVEQDSDADDKSGTWESGSVSDGWVTSCVKNRKLTWLEKTLWHMYDTQANGSLDWLSTSRNTLTASTSGVNTLKNSGAPDSSKWDAKLQPYFNAAQGILLVVAIISLTVVFIMMVHNIRDGDDDGRLLSKTGWIAFGAFLGSVSVTVTLRLFSRAHSGMPGMASWDPNGGTTYFVSDWVRMQLDPIYIIALVAGVMAAGFKLAVQQEGRELVRFGRALGMAAITGIALAGLVNTLNGLFDTWSAQLMSSASSMVSDAWSRNSLQASDFFKLDAPIAIVLVILMWLMSLVMKIFAYLRAGLLPILVGVAPTWAAMSWSNEGRQAFGKTIGWLVAFMVYKPVCAMVMATGSAIMVTSAGTDDSTAITLTLTLSAIIILPALIKLIVPAAQNSVGGGGAGMPAVLGGAATVAASGMSMAAHGGAGLFSGIKNRLSGGGSKGSDGPDGAQGRHSASLGSTGAGGSGAAGSTGSPSRANAPDGANGSGGSNGAGGTQGASGTSPASDSPSSRGADGSAGTDGATGSPALPSSAGSPQQSGSAPQTGSDGPDGVDARTRRREIKEF